MNLPSQNTGTSVTEEKNGPWYFETWNWNRTSRLNEPCCYNVVFIYLKFETSIPNQTQYLYLLFKIDSLLIEHCIYTDLKIIVNNRFWHIISEKKKCVAGDHKTGYLVLTLLDLEFLLLFLPWLLPWQLYMLPAGIFSFFFIIIIIYFLNFSFGYLLIIICMLCYVMAFVGFGRMRRVGSI
jgi:hypothetical protein